MGNVLQPLNAPNSKLGFTGIHIFFLEPPHRGGSNAYPQSYVLSRNMKNIRIFFLKTFIFGGEIFNIFEEASFCNVECAQ